MELEPFEMAVHPLHDPSTGRPITPLTWFEAIGLCNELSEADGLQPAYARGEDGRTVTWNTSADGYRLPTEAEWEYACRAGTSSPTYGPLENIAWTSLDHLDAPWSVRASVRRGSAPDAVLEDVGLRVARGSVGTAGEAQGWSHEADRQRAAIRGPLPVGWTPLRDILA